MCPYCGRRARLVNGYAIYRRAGSRLGNRSYWLCSPCNAYVGCHPGTDRALGRLANSELRAWKQRAHRAFDPLWRRGPMRRKDAYYWLSRRLGIPLRECHIGEFDVALCKLTVTECDRYGRRDSCWDEFAEALLDYDTKSEKSTVEH